MKFVGKKLKKFFQTIMSNTNEKSKPDSCEREMKKITNEKLANIRLTYVRNIRYYNAETNIRTTYMLSENVGCIAKKDL